MRLILLLILLILPAAGTLRGAAHEEADVIRTARAILEMPHDQAAKSLPIEMTGAITFVDANLALWFAQDSTAGLYLYPSPNLTLVRGETYKLTGYTAKGLHSNFMVVEKAETALPIKPHPTLVSVLEANSGGYDCQFLEVEGVVRAFSADSKLVEMEIGNRYDQLRVVLPASAVPNPAGLINARVRVQGVNTASFNSQREFSGFTLRVPTAQHFSLVEPAPKTDSEPLFSLDSLDSPIPEPKASHRLRIIGSILCSWADGRAIIAGDTSSLLVKFAIHTPVLQPGTKAEVAGFLSYTDDEYCLSQAAIRNRSDEIEPIPQGYLLNRQNGKAGRAKLSGKVLATYRRGDKGAHLSILSSDTVVKVFAPADSPLLRQEHKGAFIETEGILRWNDVNGFQQAEIWMSSMNSFRILPEIKSVRNPTMPILILTNVLLLGFTAWLLLRRRALRSPSSVPALAFSIQGREKLARDLHDGIIQSLYAIGLTVDNCKSILKSSPAQAEARLGSVVKEVNSSIAHLRDLISGLSTEPLKPGEFKAALKSVILTLGESHPTKIILEVDQAASELLTSSQATQLLHIAREAISNSLRHAQAQRLTITFHQASDSRLTLEITDDGKGFDPESIPRGHGLNNISARSREIRGTLSLHSKPDYGTKVNISLPVDR